MNSGDPSFSPCARPMKVGAMSGPHTPNSSVSSSHRFSPRVANPWENDSRAVTAIRNCLILAEQMGLPTMPKENKQRCAEQLASLPSTKIIEIQKEVSTKTKTLYKFQKDIAAHEQEMEAGDFLQIKNIESRINMVTQLCTDLDKVMQNTDTLVHRLRKPIVGEYLKMDSQYHREACEVLTMLVPTLNDLSRHIDNISWAADHDFSAAYLETLLSQVQSLIASAQTSFHNIKTVRRGISDLRKHQSISCVNSANASLLDNSASAL